MTSSFRRELFRIVSGQPLALLNAPHYHTLSLRAAVPASYRAAGLSRSPVVSSHPTSRLFGYRHSFFQPSKKCTQNSSLLASVDPSPPSTAHGHPSTTSFPTRGSKSSRFQTASPTFKSKSRLGVSIMFYAHQNTTLLMKRSAEVPIRSDLFFSRPSLTSAHPREGSQLRSNPAE